MNVIVANQQESILSTLNIEIIKSLRGEFEVDELIGTFSNFFFARMILDITALRNHDSIVTYQKLSIGLPVDKIILLIPETSPVAASNFLSQLISLGYYNFTTNKEGIEYLIENPNTYKDVAHLHVVEQVVAPVAPTTNGQPIIMSSGRIIGVKNVTDHAGATTLIYMMKKIATENGVSALAVEIERRDFTFYNDPGMISATKSNIANELLKAKNFNVVFLDLNDGNEELCDEVLYLIEPSILKLNKLMLRDPSIFSKLIGKKVIVNHCMLSDSDIATFQMEAGINLFFALGPFNDRVNSESVYRLLVSLGVIQAKPADAEPSHKGFLNGIFH